MIGIIPAAGHATRINGIPKYLLPVPDGLLIDVLHRRMREADADQVLVGVGPHSSESLRTENRLLYTVNTQTMSETVLAARQHFDDPDESVLFGMPDSYWLDDNVYQRLTKDIDHGALVSVALFETRPGQENKLGMCDVSFDNDVLRITQIADKPKQTTLHWAWGAMAWCAGFWKYIQPSDPHVGYALQRAVEAHDNVHAQLIYGPYFDCGTAAEYFTCIRQITVTGVS